MIDLNDLKMIIEGSPLLSRIKYRKQVGVGITNKVVVEKGEKFSDLNLSIDEVQIVTFILGYHSFK